jgi:hypothetical protein
MALIAISVYCTQLSARFEYGSDMLERPIRLFVALSMVAGTLYLGAMYILMKITLSRRWLFLIIGAGLLMRSISFFSNPILEDDFYRYLWDGGVSASGHNPYRYIPDDVFYFHEPLDVPSSLVALSEEAGIVAARVNHSGLGTIYPPVAQGAFTIAHWIHPWSLQSWRSVLFVFDCVAAFLIVTLLRKAGLPSHYVAIYWLNPVLIKETYNSLHMDLLIIPFLLLSLFWISSNRPMRAGLATVAAVGCKLWPLILVPTLIRHRNITMKKLALVTGCSALFLFLLCWPMLAAVQSGSSSGFFAYGERWEMNDALFMVFDWTIQTISKPFSAAQNTTDWIVRILIGGVLLAWTVWNCRAQSKTIPELANRWVLITGALFMLSPTQFPWYYLWVLPWLAIAPRYSMLVLTAMLPMYYLKFYYQAIDQVDFFHNRLVWLEYAPTFALIIWEFYRYTKEKRLEPLEHYAK